jgi:uncharacterized membrane protein
VSPHRDPLRFHRAHRKHLIGSDRAERLVEFVAEGIGTVAFLVIALVIIILWILINGGYAYFSHAIVSIQHGKPFDPAPWILLNLVFSFEAFFTGSLVVIAAKAQAKRDLDREAADAKHREELAAEHSELIKANTELTNQVHTLATEIKELLAEKRS